MRAHRLIPVCLALLAGCATVPETAIKQPLAARAPAPAMAALANGAIFQAGDSRPRPGLALFEDRRARYVGDTLVVNLVERTSASRKSETTDERKANADLNIPGPVLLGNARGIGATVWAPEASSKQEFKDNESNSNTVTGAITVTVVEQLPNGNLVVAGEKQVAINGDTEYIRLAGVVNPSQIGADNSVDSTLLANVQFESKNSQGLDRAQLTSLLARFFLTVLPF